MSRTLKATVVLSLLVLVASACTRRVQVESEPSRTEAADTTDARTPRS